MRQTQTIMGMPVAIEIIDPVSESTFGKIFNYFISIDERFSTYKDTSEISAINQGKLRIEDSSQDMQTVFTLSEETKQLTNGYFDIERADGRFDPSGLVKGWAIWNGAKLLKELGVKNFCVDVGGDIEVSGKNKEGRPWSIGIRDPLQKNKKKQEVIKVIYLKNSGAVATSGTYLRGDHIYDPHNRKTPIGDIVSLTVIGPNIYEADRFATAAFAMGKDGIMFIEELEGFEGYQIDGNGIAVMTSGFHNYTKEND